MITGHDLIEGGWQPGPVIKEALGAAREMEAKGITDKKYILKTLAKRFPKGEKKIGMRENGPAFSEAIEATCEQDEANIGGVRRKMRELMRVPVIERGSVMPDACPAGAAEATIPVGGAISVTNAIIPSAHSADICCSMFCTLDEHLFLTFTVSQHFICLVA